MELDIKSIILASLFTGIFCRCSVSDIALTYSMVNERFDQSMAWNNTHPERIIAQDSDDYKLLIMADVHVGGTVNLQKFVGMADTSKALAVIGVGDMVNGQAVDYDNFESQLTCHQPTFLITGNHDLHYGGWSEFYNRFGSSSYCLTVQTGKARDLLIFLDNGSGTIGDRQLVWFENILKTIRPSYRNCMVFSHLDFIREIQSEASTAPVEEISAMLGLLAANRVNLVVSGHEHQHSSVTFGNTTFVVADALMDSDTDHEYESTPEGWVPGYLEIDVREGSLSSRFLYLPEERTTPSGVR